MLYYKYKGLLSYGKHCASLGLVTKSNTIGKYKNCHCTNALHLMSGADEMKLNVFSDVFVTDFKFFFTSVCFIEP